jgi:hypothetical protein
MNMKRIFGAVLTILGIAGLIYAAVLFAYSGGGFNGYQSAYHFWHCRYNIFRCRYWPYSHNKRCNPNLKR